MRHHGHKTLLVIAAILFSATAGWAAEPSSTTVDTPAAPAGTVDANGLAPAPAGADSPAPAEGPSQSEAPLSPAAAASPSAVGASPYGNGASDPPAAPPPPAQPKNDVPATLLASGQDYAIGGFGGVGVMYTRFAGNDRPLVCGEGAVIIDHMFTLGGGGCGVAAVMDGSRYGNPPHSTSDRMSFGYGGAIIRYHLFSRQVVNLALGGLIGAGGLHISQWDGTGSSSDYNDENYSPKGQDAVFVFEPQVGGFANLTRWLRVGVLGGYRIVSGVETKGLGSKDLSGPTLGGQIQAGWF